MKKMFYLVDTCGKELVACLHKATADGKFLQHKYSYKMHCEIMVWKPRKFYEYIVYLKHEHFPMSAYHVANIFTARCY
jgi:hypothetical protein